MVQDLMEAMLESLANNISMFSLVFWLSQTMQGTNNTCRLYLDCYQIVFSRPEVCHE